MKRLTYWSIEERKERRLSNISALSYRISGCIYGHESIKDGETFRSGSDIQGMVVSADEVIVRTEHSVYYCKMQDAFWSRMDETISWLFGSQALELNEGLTVFVDQSAENLIRKICYKDRINGTLTWTLAIPKPRNSRHLMVTCGDCAVSMDMIRQSDCGHLYAKGVEQRYVKNADRGEVTLWVEDDLKKLKPDELVEF